METQKKRLGDLLIDCNLINEQQLNQALNYQKDKKLKVGEALIDMGFVTEDDIIWALGNQLNISFIHLNADIVDREVTEMVTPEFAKEHKIIPLYKAGNQLSVCMVDPLDSRPVEYLQEKYGISISVSICTLFDFEHTFSDIFGTHDFQEKVRTDPENLEQVSEVKEIERGIPRGMEEPEKVINYILGQAIINNVNRIHFEPSEKGILIRFRSNNVLSRKIEVPLKVHQAIIEKLKKLSHISKNQSNHSTVINVGHFRVTVSNRQINVQSVFYPTVNGEMVILKLSDFVSVLEQLPQNTKACIEAIARRLHSNHGVLYVTGPHESGRTTTSYCIISSYDAEKSKIVTIENPVSVNLPGTTQLQIGNTGIKNALEGLKLSFLLDADLVYLDCLDEPELSEEVGFAGLGGKSVICSFLAHDAASSIVKLIKMSEDRVVIASSSCGFLCQRLVRILCKRCRQQDEISVQIKEVMETYSDLPDKPEVFTASGCEGCNHTGYSTKALITEFIPDSHALRKMIMNGQSYQDFVSFARKQGIKSLEQKTLELVLSGETSSDEYLRLF